MLRCRMPLGESIAPAGNCRGLIATRTVTEFNMVELLDGERGVVWSDQKGREIRRPGS